MKDHSWTLMKCYQGRVGGVVMVIHPFFALVCVPVTPKERDVRVSARGDPHEVRRFVPTNS